MPTRTFLADQNYTPESITVMSAAFECVCSDMRLADKTDRLTEVLAKRVIDLAAEGFYTDPGELHAAVIASFKRGQ